MMSRAVSLLLFLAMCLVWGLTWIAIKTGLREIPPLFFAGTRFVVAGLLLLGWERLAERRSGGVSDGSPGRALRRADAPAVLVTSLLLIVATYSLLFWGMERVASGLAAVLNLALM